jgi:hypothetical protein
VDILWGAGRRKRIDPLSAAHRRRRWATKLVFPLGRVGGKDFVYVLCYSGVGMVMTPVLFCYGLVVGNNARQRRAQKSKDDGVKCFRFLPYLINSFVLIKYY